MQLIPMDRHTRANVMRVLRLLARTWQMPTELAYRRIQQAIDESWELAQEPGKETIRELWQRYFPGGKPTPEEYFIWYAAEQEAGRKPPYLFNY